MLFQNKRSLWMEGLLYAEQIGVCDVIEQLHRNEFDDSYKDFDIGVRDYIDYYKEKLDSSSGDRQ